MMAIAEQDRLKLEAELADVVAILMDSYDSGGTGLAPPITQAYAARIAHIGEQAKDAGLAGLSLACSVLQQRLQPYSDRPAGGTIQELLEEWPVLAMSYLAEPADEQQLHDLLQHLQSDAWELPLPDTALEQLDLLLGDASNDSMLTDSTEPAGVTSAGVIPESSDAILGKQLDSANSNLTVESEHPALNEASSPPSQAEPMLPAMATDESVAPAASVTSVERIDRIETETATIQTTEPTPLFSEEPTGPEPSGLEAVQSGIAALLDILAPALEDNSPATLNLILRRFAAQLHKISDSAVATGLLGFYDLSLLFAEQLNQISEREDSCSQDELALLEEWPTLAMCYLDAPGDPANAQALIEHMTNSAWRAPIQAEEAEMLLDMLQQSAISTDTLAFDDSDITPAGDPLATDSEAGLWAGASATEDPDNIPLWGNSSGNETTGTEPLFAADEPDISPETTASPPAEAALFVTDEVTEQTALDAEIAVSDETPDLPVVQSDESSSIAFSDAAEMGISEEPEHLTPALHSGLNADDYPAESLNSEAAIASDSDMPDDLDLSDEPSVTTDLDLSDDEAPASISEDLLEIMQAELAEIAEAGEQSLNVVQNPASTAEQRQQALESYTEELERLSLAADSIGLQGLAQLCAHLHANLDAFTAREQVLSEQESALLRGWQQPVLDYLEAIGTEASSRQLVNFMSQAEWLLPLDQDAANDILESLRHPAPSLEDFGDIEERPREARPEDVSLELPPETNPELLDSLLQELPNQTSEFSAAIQQLYEGTGTPADMEAAQRIAHTLKGAGNTVGVTGIATITHHIEDILIALGKEHSLPTRKLSGVLMDAADCLESMCESLLGLSDPPAQSQAVLQTILDLANRIDREGVPSIMADDSVITPVREEPTPVTPAVTDTAPSQTPAPVLSQQPAQPVQQAAAASTTQREDSAATAMVRVPATLIDELLRLVGESIILTGQVQERIRANMAQATLVREQNKTLLQLVSELEQLVDVQGVGLPSMAVRQDGHFDPLEMDQYNELHTVTRRLVEAAADAQALDEGISDNFAELDTLMSDQTQVHRDTQETVMRTRMVTIQTVVPRLQRAVRQTGRLTDKEVELTVKGSNTLIDSNVLSDIIDPLMHILRNAIDHGIEPPEVRKAHNKPGNGHITLSFQREGNSIVVRCQDDGKGLDLDGIRHTAEQRGLLLPGQSMSEEELTRLILQPGFSTRTQTTQVSGRGIGMDVVYSEVLQLKGSLAIKNDPGKGCTIEMRLPVTLISTHALMVRCGEDIFAVAERGIEQLVHATTGEVMNISDRLVYKLNEQLYDVLQLESLLHLPLYGEPEELMQRPALLVRDETGAIKAVMVEEMIDSRDLVVKPIGHFTPHVRGVLGATILGDGSITPVLDMPDLLRSTGVATPGTQPGQSRTAYTAAAKPASRPKALIVDDSLSVRRTMQQLVSDAGFDVITARDGLEAVAILNTEVPAVMLVDMEMPRMNGLELTLHARAQTTTRDLPIIMITSRSTAKHRQEAEIAGVNEYLVKPVADDELIGLINKAVMA